MQRSRICTLLATLLAPVALLAQNVTSSGTLSSSIGGVLLDGDRPAFQQLTQTKKGGFIGLDEFQLTSEGESSVFKFEARLMPSDDSYRLVARFDKSEKYYIEGGYDQFRVWYDGSSTRLPDGSSFVMFDEDLSLKRSKLWLEAGYYTPNQTLLKFRLEQGIRDGSKSSTKWGDSSLAGRNIVPSFYNIDEETTTLTVDIGNESQEEVKWNVGGRYHEAKLNNAHWFRRRPFESADRQVTSKDGTTTDIFAVHGFYMRKLNEKLTVSAGALRTDLDTNLVSSRIYGQSYDAVYDPAFLRRQQRDHGFFGLHGDGEVNQTVLNVNAVYVPRPHWSIRPSLRFENLSQEMMAEFTETEVGAANTGFLMAEHHGETVADKEYDEFTGNLEARYTGLKNMVFSATGEWIHGTGTLDEKYIDLHSMEADPERLSDDSRDSQKLALDAKWYVKPGLSLFAQYYYQVKINDYDATLDNTVGSYPSYLSDQDFETNDINVRLSWKPFSQLSLISRYDLQKSTITTIAVGLGKQESLSMDTHILSQNVTWTPNSRLYLTASANFNFDRMEMPENVFARIKHADNNAVSGSLSGGYTVSKKDDLYVDYSMFRSSNFIDYSALSLPFGSSVKQNVASITWVRRMSENLSYTTKYSLVTNRDDGTGGINNFDAHVLYARVQYRF